MKQKPVSVPCRGLFYFITIMTFDTETTTVFPSPAGGFFISSEQDAENMKIALDCFRPLPGAFLFHLKYEEFKDKCA